MPIRVTCSNCKKGVTAPSKYAGRTVKCPGCGSELHIPKRATIAVRREKSGLAETKDVASVTDTKETPFLSAKRFAFGNESVGFWIVILLILLLFGRSVSDGQSFSEFWVGMPLVLWSSFALAAAFAVGCNRPIYGWKLLLAYFALLFFTSPLPILAPNFAGLLRHSSGIFGTLFFSYVIFGIPGEIFIGRRRARALKKYVSNAL